MTILSVSSLRRGKEPSCGDTRTEKPHTHTHRMHRCSRRHYTHTVDSFIVARRPLEQQVRIAKKKNKKQQERLRDCVGSWRRRRPSELCLQLPTGLNKSCRQRRGRHDRLQSEEEKSRGVGGVVLCLWEGHHYYYDGAGSTGCKQQKSVRVPVGWSSCSGTSGTMEVMQRR